MFNKNHLRAMMADTGADHAAPEAAEKPAPTPRVKAPEQNGVSMPAAGTKTGRVWEIATSLSEQLQRPALRDEVMSVAEDEGLAKGTIATQYGKWCTFYGVSADQRKAVRAENKPAPAEKSEAPAEEQAPVADPVPESDEE